jgi:hypothetical protein
MKRSTWVEIIVALFILLFTYTALNKLIDWFHFKNVLYGAPLIGNKAPFVSRAVPIVELCVSLLLFIPRTRRLGLWGSLALMIVFTAYIGYMLFISSALPCRCGGVLEQMTWNQHFYFNIFFLLLAILGLWLGKKSRNNSTQDLVYKAAM